MLRLAGFPDADARAKRDPRTGTLPSRKSTSPSPTIEDIHKANNTWKQADFAAKAPGLDWAEYLPRRRTRASRAEFTVWQPTAFTGESALVASVPLETWKDWLAYHLIEDYAGVSAQGAGRRRLRVLRQDAVRHAATAAALAARRRFVDALLGDAVGKIYAQRYFPPEAKAQAQAMVANIIAAFRKRVEALAWMAPATKAEAVGQTQHSLCWHWISGALA